MAEWTEGARPEVVTLVSAGIVIYGAVFMIDKMPFPAAKDASSLADFKIYHSISKLPDGPDTEGHLVLPTGAEQQP